MFSHVPGIPMPSRACQGGASRLSAGYGFLQLANGRLNNGGEFIG
jgi:hypothetical protein